MPIVACCLVLLAGCSDPPSDPAMVAQSNGALLPTVETVVSVRIVDADSAPLAGMVPVAMDGPSPISKTISKGSTTDADGAARLSFPKGNWVYVRGTDPDGNMVSSNYLDIQPGDAPESDEAINLSMNATATVTAALQRGDGSPIANEAVQLLMMHPAHGKWWQVEGVTDATGTARFTGLPAGVFALKWEFLDQSTAAVREVVLSGGEVKDLGAVSAQAAE